MVARLTLAGIRSISLLVDITNYVMLELGQPIHGYDLDKLTGGIVVRRASAGEKLATLDGKVRDAPRRGPAHHRRVRARSASPASWAARTTEMTQTTRNVLDRGGDFDPVSIARTARRHKLPSEASRASSAASTRTSPIVAAQRVVDLLVELAGGTADATAARC